MISYERMKESGDDMTPSAPTEPQPATVEALLAAGRALFAEHGFDGASVRALTAAAGANLGAITYHFGSKEGFYNRVVESTMAPVADAVVAAATGPGTPLERVEAVVRAFFDLLAAAPDFPRFMLQGLVAGGMPPAGAMGPLQRILGALTGLVREGQAEGSLRPGPTMAMALSIVSHPVHLTVVRRPLKLVGGLDLDDPATRRELVENAVRFACGGLAAHGAGCDSNGRGTAR
jgi:AcrR family transcriptional regulator